MHSTTFIIPPHRSLSSSSSSWRGDEDENDDVKGDVDIEDPSMKIVWLMKSLQQNYYVCFVEAQEETI